MLLSRHTLLYWLTAIRTIVKINKKLAAAGQELPSPLVKMKDRARENYMKAAGGITCRTFEHACDTAATLSVENRAPMDVVGLIRKKNSQAREHVVYPTGQIPTPAPTTELIPLTTIDCS